MANTFPKLVFLATVLCVQALSICANAQVADSSHFANSLLAKKHKELFTKAVTNAGLHKNPNYYYKYRVDVTKSQELKNLGVDLSDMDKRVGLGDYKESLVYADVVVSGVVISKEYDSNPNNYYHSTYMVRVNKVLHGKVKADIIRVKLVSGPVGSKYVNSDDEPSIFLGEQVVLYLNQINFTEILNAKANGRWNHDLNANLTDFDILAKYYVKSSYIFDSDNRKISKASEFEANVKKVSSVLDKENFYTKTF